MVMTKVHLARAESVLGGTQTVAHETLDLCQRLTQGLGQRRCSISTDCTGDAQMDE